MLTTSSEPAVPASTVGAGTSTPALGTASGLVTPRIGAGLRAGPSAALGTDTSADRMRGLPGQHKHDGLVDGGSGLRLSAPLRRLPVLLSVAVPVRGFRVRNLLAMARGDVIPTQWGHGEDLPVTSGDVQLAWSEFEVVDTRLAVRVTRLA